MDLKLLPQRPGKTGCPPPSLGPGWLRTNRERNAPIIKTIAVSAAFITDRIEATRDFYVRYIGARVTFDCGWYLNLEFGNPNQSLQFMAPRESDHRLGQGVGLIYNFNVSDVDREHARLAAEGLSVVMPLEDHPWGDRGFSILDPNGISVYIYSEREPSEAFKEFYKD